MMRALERGLALQDFKELTFGMILDYIITYNNAQAESGEQREVIRTAGQSDFDGF